ncbi:response regulator [Massilia sp. PAMC28688]|uniref:hybrid sensor histidine kinase/response regulator n=1 Tax=Massilia sp. PAMC28688 TaxID=2861283 RepID=UPI001C62DFCD|nr:response regulator [Massilia sp. PAMC28688]QYF93695.1 response regulator [Massilia sp. PAMC28688]
MTRLRHQTASVCAALLALLSLYVLTGWVLGNSSMVRVIPGSVAISINTAVMFLVGSIALELVRRHQTGTPVFHLLTLALITLSSAIFAEHLFDIDLGIDLAAVHAALGDGHAKPGRTAPNACIGFLSAGLALACGWGWGGPRIRPLARWFANLTLLIGVAGFAGYLLGLDAMYRIASLNRMATFTALGMTALGLGLRVLSASGKAVPLDEAGRITRLAGMLLVVFAIATGLSSFALLRGSFEQSAAEHHAYTARTAASSMSGLLQDAVLLSSSVAHRPSLLRAMQGLARNEDDQEAMQRLQSAATAFPQAGFSARIVAASGAQLYESGDMNGAPAFAVSFGTSTDVTALYFNQGYRVRSTHIIRAGAQILGTVTTERKLTPLDDIISEHRQASATTDVVLCGYQSSVVKCFPSRFYPKGEKYALRDAQGRPALPISRALLGESGATRLKDPRGVAVLAGFTGLPDFPLGIVVKTDLSELYLPLREKLHWLIAAVALFVLIGTFLLRRLVEPLIGQIVTEKRRVKNLLDNSNDAFIAIGPDGCVSDWNRQAELMLGIPAEKALGRDLAQLIIPVNQRAAHNAGFARFLNGATGNAINNRVQVHVVHASGHEIPVELSVSAVMHPDGRGASAFLRDLTAQRAAEAKAAEQSQAIEEARLALAKSQRLEAVGKLTGGVAHDFNNVLQVVRGNLELLSQEAPPEPAARRVHSAMEAVDRGARLSAQLLAFARRQPLEPQPTDLGRVVRSMEDMLQRAIGDAIEIEVVISGSLWHALVDPNQLEHVILNLAINARDAMKGSGKLTIEAGNAALDEDYAQREPGLQAGQFVVLAISDTGCGMSPEVLERAFEPFFTTKAEGEGTGLGLSMAYGFAKQSNGHIKIYSEVGEGTTIRIYLPRTGAALTQHQESASQDIVGGSETVLVVEDDAAVQATVVEMLLGLGYKVLKASHAAEAMDMIEAGAAVDLLFTDVVMPGPLRSPDLARRASALLPGLKVLFTSGYTQNAIVHGGRLDPGIALLSKPYRRDQLARKVRAVLGPATATPAAVPAAPLIAFVEDNDDFRMLGVELLAMLGHTAHSFASAEEALEPLRSGRFTMLLTDVGLPGMSGVELGAIVHAENPAIQVVFASGFGEALTPRPDFPHRILTKPFTIEDLQACLSNAR